MTDPDGNAFGKPGIPARWTSSAKSGVGTSLNPASRIWFTLSHGIFDEIYYPRVDQACTRDMGMIVTSGDNFFSEEKRDTDQKIQYLAPGVPAYHLENTCTRKRYRIIKDILSDPNRDTVLQHTRFEVLDGERTDYHLYILLSPHLSNQGAGNTAWVGDYKGVKMLFAERDGNALALACSVPWKNCSAGYVGVSDGWQDLNQHKQMTWFFSRAEDGNVALTGEINFDALEDGREGFTLALGFGTNPSEAGQRALASLLDGFEKIKKAFLDEWQDWQKRVNAELDQGSEQDDANLYRTSMMILRAHEAKRFPGGLIASLSIPWGFSRGDNDLGGYHLVWPRDLVESAGGLLAGGAFEDVRRVLRFLEVTQEADGHWPQNMWLDGRSYWSGIQMDETAFPILLVDLARREKALDAEDIHRLWRMVHRAAGYLACNGPVTQQDRWEEDPGYSPFTLAVEIAALLAAADIAEENGAIQEANYLRDTADTWNANIERWIYVTQTDLARQYNIEGYYVRIAPPEEAESSDPAKGFVPIKNRPPGESSEPADYIVSPDVLALVRFGLRAPDDPRILNTLKVIDNLLKVDTPNGACWHRYNDDGYGEHEDGSPFDGTGVGRAWPLLTAERAHYELAAGNIQQAQKLMADLRSFANQGGMIPEQIWDTEDIPEQELFFGHPSGSAMPLVWAHAEYVKLHHSLQDQAVFDMPVQTVQRYRNGKITAPYNFWRFNHKSQSLEKGKNLRIELLAPARVHWSSDDWKSTADLPTQDSGLGIYFVDLPVDQLETGTQIRFTFFWIREDRWAGADFKCEITAV